MDAEAGDEIRRRRGGKSRVLIIGATGRLGKEMVAASLAAGHPTFALVRHSSAAVAGDGDERTRILRSFSASGVALIKGELEDLGSLIEAVKQVDVVICTVPSARALDQKFLIEAIEEAGCIERFVPSEFGADPSKVRVRDLDCGFYEKKLAVRRLIEFKCIPHTYISCNFFMRYLLPSLVQPGLDAPPRDEMKIFGNGNVKGHLQSAVDDNRSLTLCCRKISGMFFLLISCSSAAVFLKESDVAAYTICAVDDPRTLNKTVYLRPPGNACSMNELARIWESKIGKELKKVHVSEEQLLQLVHETPLPDKMDLVFIYSAFVKGDHTYFDMDSAGVNGTELYSHVKHTTVSELLESMLATAN